jgi:hypothetical protein
MDSVSCAHTADAPSDGEEGGSHSGLTISNIISLSSRPEETLAPPHDSKEAYRRDLEAFSGDLSSQIKLEPGIPQLDIARRTTLDDQWLLEDRALQIVIRDSFELTTSTVSELVEEIVRLDDDEHVPERAVDYTSDGVGVRVGFLCATTAQRDRIAVALNKSLERLAVDLKLFPADNKQREAILGAALSIQRYFEPHNLDSIGGSVSLQPGVELVGIVKHNQHLSSLPGEGPRNVIASADIATAEATEALKGITIATPGTVNSSSSAKDGKKKKDGKKNTSGGAAAKRLKKLKIKHAAKRL